MKLLLRSGGTQLSVTREPMLVSFTLTPEVLDEALAFGITYYDEATGTYIMLETTIQYWDENANDGLGGWTVEPVSSSAGARIVTEQSVTGTFVLIGLSK